MNYEKIYNRLISYRQQNSVTSGYKENHHIIPESLGGTKAKENMVYLTAREHYIAHLLLARFNRCKETIYSLMMMSNVTSDRNYGRKHFKNSRLYEWYKQEYIKILTGITGEAHHSFGRKYKWIHNPITDKNSMISLDTDPPEGWILGYFIKDSAETKRKKREAAKKRFQNDAERNKISDTLKEYYSTDRHKKCKHTRKKGRKASEETRKKISDANFARWARYRESKLCDVD